MTDRSEDAGKELLEELKAKYPSQELAFAPLDLQGASFAADARAGYETPPLIVAFPDVHGIARLVETFNARFKRLDGLANCAGTVCKVSRACVRVR